MDRLIPLIDPHFEKDETGECRHLKRIEKTPQNSRDFKLWISGTKPFSGFKIVIQKNCKKYPF